jgi:hypothetical protein
MKELPCTEVYSSELCRDDFFSSRWESEKTSMRRRIFTTRPQFFHCLFSQCTSYPAEHFSVKIFINSSVTSSFNMVRKERIDRFCSEHSVVCMLVYKENAVI